MGNGTGNGTARDRGMHELRGGCEAGCARRRRRPRAARDEDVDVVLDGGKTCACVAHDGQRDRTVEGRDVRSDGVECTCDQTCVPTKRAGGCGRCRRHHLTGASELRRQISVTSRGWGAARGVYSGRGWFERDRKRADLAAATGSTGGLPLILLSGGFLSGELLSTWTEKSPDRCRKPTTC